jgi:hypothetical protein
MSAEAVKKKRPVGVTAPEEEPEAHKGQLDVARGLENLPVSVWPRGAWPAPFQVGAGLGGLESRVQLPGVELNGCKRQARSSPWWWYFSNCV